MRERRVVPRQIRYLLAVAEHRNFTRAAEALGVSQPGLSQQIRQIEEYLGATLFDRTGRAVRITDAGDVYLEYARKALRELEAGWRALQEVDDLSRGVLRLACTPSFIGTLMPKWAYAFHQKYPNVRIEISGMPLDAIEAALDADEVDVAVGFTDVNAEDIHATPLFDEQPMLIVSEKHEAFRHQEAIAAEPLSRLPLVMLTSGFAARAYADAYFRAHDIEPNIAIEANSIGAVLKIVELGEMGTVLPQLDGEASPGLRNIRLAQPVARRPVALLQKRRGHRTAASLAFAELVLTEIQAA
ncbi:transcriptional regulator CynR [Pandoraea sp. NPDC087047]|uniref:transcriptional regulator CynR n=1 Tax=Pandoraea sp. NPDC087047 TaxID=3364390 RepID=UPI003829F194